jgi:hypothetical protein
MNPKSLVPSSFVTLFFSVFAELFVCFAAVVEASVCDWRGAQSVVAQAVARSQVRMFIAMRQRFSII